MIRSELRSRVRSSCNEPTERFVGNALIDDWLGDAFTDFAEKTEFFEDAQSMDSVSGVGEYAMPAGTLRITGVWWKNRRIGYVTIRELDEDRPDWRIASPGTPSNWTVESRGKFRLWIPPNETTAGAILLDRLFVPTWTGDTEPPGLPQREYQMGLIWWVCARIKERDREWDGAAYFDSRYLAVLGKVRAGERFHQKGTDRDRIQRMKPLSVDRVRGGTF